MAIRATVVAQKRGGRSYSSPPALTSGVHLCRGLDHRHLFCLHDRTDEPSDAVAREFQSHTTGPSSRRRTITQRGGPGARTGIRPLSGFSDRAGSIAAHDISGVFPALTIAPTVLARCLRISATVSRSGNLAPFGFTVALKPSATRLDETRGAWRPGSPGTDARWLVDRAIRAPGP